MSLQDIRNRLSKGTAKQSSAPAVDYGQLANDAQKALNDSKGAFDGAKGEYDTAISNPQTKADFEDIKVKADLLNAALTDLKSKSDAAFAAWNAAGDSVKAGEASDLYTNNAIDTSDDVSNANAKIAEFDRQEGLDEAANVAQIALDKAKSNLDIAMQEFNTANSSAESKSDFEVVVAKANALNEAYADLEAKSETATTAWNAAGDPVKAGEATKVYTNNAIDTSDAVSNANKKIAESSQRELNDSKGAFDGAKGEYDTAISNPQTKADFEVVVAKANALNEAYADLEAKSETATAAWNAAGDSVKAGEATKVYTDSFVDTSDVVSNANNYIEKIARQEEELAKKVQAADGAQDALNASKKDFDAAKGEYNAATSNPQTKADFEDVKSKAVLLNAALADLKSKSYAASSAWDAVGDVAQAKAAADLYTNNAVDTSEVVESANTRIEEFAAQESINKIKELDAEYKNLEKSAASGSEVDTWERVKDKFTELMKLVKAINIDSLSEQSDKDYLNNLLKEEEVVTKRIDGCYGDPSSCKFDGNCIDHLDAAYSYFEAGDSNGKMKSLIKDKEDCFREFKAVCDKSYDVSSYRMDEGVLNQFCEILGNNPQADNL